MTRAAAAASRRAWDWSWCGCCAGSGDSGSAGSAPAAVAAVLLAAAVAVGTLDRDRLAQASKSFGYRLQYWQSSLQMIADHPWLGCGPGNFQDAYTRYKLPEASEEIADPHNFLLEIWATAGTPAALAFLAVLGCFAWSTLEASR